MESDETAPPYGEQRQYIWAFRKFIRNPAHQNENGKGWTPAVVLRELWELSDERARGRLSEHQFKARHYQTIERLRGTGKKQRVEDGALYRLILRFLDTHCEPAAHPATVTLLRDSLRTFSHLFPVGFSLPSSVPYQPGVMIYELITSPSRGVKESTFFALDLPKRHPPQSACPVIAFSTQKPFFTVGIYIFAILEAYTRQISRFGPVWYRWSFPRKARGEGYCYNAATPPRRVVRKSFNAIDGYEQFYAGFKYSRSSDTEALKFAQATFRELDN
jgi:hypothetical protein